MQVFIKGSQNTSQALIDTVKNKTYGEEDLPLCCMPQACVDHFRRHRQHKPLGSSSASAWCTDSRVAAAVGAFNTTRTNHTLVCLPDPFSDDVGERCLPLRCLCQSGAMRPH